jgi:hypothetical protein
MYFGFVNSLERLSSLTLINCGNLFHEFWEGMEQRRSIVTLY